MSQPRIGRRFFLQVVGATSVAAGCSPSHAPEKLIPLLNPPENMVPGQALFYRTVCRACPAGCGVTARSREGRVVKVEGNPEDPISAGALCARGQAQVQTLYSPTRLRGPMMRKGDALVAVSWAEAMAALQAALGKLRGQGGQLSGLRLVSRCEPGSAGAVQQAFAAGAGAQRTVFEPGDAQALREANGGLFGNAGLPILDLTKARAVVSFGADFLETWLSPVEQARQFMAQRGQPSRPTLTWVGPRLAMSGANADRWLKIAPGGELAVAAALLGWLLDPANKVAGLAAEAPAIRAALPALPVPDGATAAQIAALGNELATRRPSALLGPGAHATGPQATALAAVLQAANYVLGNVGQTVLLGLGSGLDAPSPAADLRALLGDAREGKVQALFALRADLAGALDGAAGASEALDRIPLLVSFGEELDATARRAHFVLPDRHALEAWGDLEPRRGVLQLQQPTMTPLWDTRSSAQVLLDLGAALSLPGLPERDFRALSQKRWQAALKAMGTATEEIQAQRDAQARGTFTAPAAATPQLFAAGALAALLRPPARAAAAAELISFPTVLAAADPDAPAWLREIPDVLTGVSWSGWVELSPAAAVAAGAVNGALLSLETAAGKAELPLWVNPMLHDRAVAVPRGAPELRLLGAGPVKVSATGRAFPLPLTGHPSQEGRGLAKVAGASGQVERDPEEEEHAHPHPHPESGEGSHDEEHTAQGTMVPPHTHPLHRWAMSIDLDKCTGCQACQVACYAENNIPVVGPEHAREGRMMAWLRLQRSFEGTGEQERIALLPSLCQQCDSAPCETVCPVYATYHNPEGLNAQVYNRCIGTRYCANNCPYDVRVFNWKDHEWPEPLQMQLNPDVTVRSKGVMEKCTFCVQRIHGAERAAQGADRALRDGDVLPACVETCPAQALVFGDANDPDARVNLAKGDGRAYALLEEANTLPAIAYLARRTGGGR